MFTLVNTWSITDKTSYQTLPSHPFQSVIARYCILQSFLAFFCHESALFLGQEPACLGPLQHSWFFLLDWIIASSINRSLLYSYIITWFKIFHKYNIILEKELYVAMDFYTEIGFYKLWGVFKIIAQSSKFWILLRKYQHKSLVDSYSHCKKNNFIKNNNNNATALKYLLVFFFFFWHK